MASASHGKHDGFQASAERSGGDVRSTPPNDLLVSIAENERFPPRGVAHDLDRTGNPLWRLSPSRRLTRCVQLAKGRLRYRFSSHTFFDYFDDARTIFVHVPKNAGSSIKKVLYEGPTGHRSAQFVRALDARKFDDYVVFATVRNPRERAVSAFQYLKYTATGQPDRRFSTRFLADVPDFASFSVRFRDPAFRRRFLRWPHFREQTQYVCDQQGRVLVDYVVAVEKLQAAWPHLEAIIGRTLPLSKANASPEADLDDGVDWRAFDTLYAADMRLWQRVMQSDVGIARREGVASSRLR